MIYLNVDADQKPEKVMMENLPGGAMTVRMADNIKEYRQEDAKDRKMYRFDEVVFELPADSTITTNRSKMTLKNTGSTGRLIRLEKTKT